MIDTIARVEKHREELDDSNTPPIDNSDLKETASSSKDRLIHQTYEVSCNPICTIDSCPELIPSDASITDVSIHPEDPPLLFMDRSDVAQSIVLPSKSGAADTPQQSVDS